MVVPGDVAFADEACPSVRGPLQAGLEAGPKTTPNGPTAAAVRLGDACVCVCGVAYERRYALPQGARPPACMRPSSRTTMRRGEDNPYNCK